MSKNHKLRSTVLTVLTLLWMILIFMMSGANDDESKAQSGSICMFLCETFIDGFEDMPVEQQQALAASLSFPVRKGAHLTEYAVLGALLALTGASYASGASSRSSFRPDESMSGSAESSSASSGVDSESVGVAAASGAASASSGVASASSGADSESVGVAPVSSGKPGMQPEPFLKPRNIMPFCIGVLYSVSDEIHQLYVPGRAGQVRDVLIDSSGVLIGVLLVYILRRMNARKKRIEMK